jgi:pyridoxal phosphate enzyme (YggS family)
MPADAGEPGPTRKPDRRGAQIAANLVRLRDRIAAACQTAGRDPAELTLVAVTKTFPVADIRRLLRLGVSDIGENRDQEARGKVAELAGEPITWHFVGQLQSNKCRSVARYAVLVHSVDRPEVVRALDRAAQHAGRTLGVLVQVSLDDLPGRGGVTPARAGELADLVAASATLRLGGVMAIAPLDADPEPAFARLAEVAAELRGRHEGARIVSAGMSGDLEAAVRHGSTHLRIGSALLGLRGTDLR